MKNGKMMLMKMMKMMKMMMMMVMKFTIDGGGAQ